MKSQKLSIPLLISEAKSFCETMSNENHKSLIGVTDGKAVGTYVEQRFQAQLSEKYSVTIGNSAKGIDLPDKCINTDIKVTSITQPQSSCPFRSAKQKVYGLGYNLLVFVYEKKDFKNKCTLTFHYCTFIDSPHTSDYSLTRRLREMCSDGANKEDIISYLGDKSLPGDEILYNELAEEILTKLPEQGYLTISNALQWRLQYSRVIALNNSISGITNYEW